MFVRTLRGLLIGAAVSILAVVSVAVPTTASAVRPAATIQLRSSVGPPTSTTRVTGTGFGADETVDLSFDSGSTVLTVDADGGGSFTARFPIPADAAPGDHAVVATGEGSGLTASAAFLVRSNWRNFHFNRLNSGANPYENVLNASNVADLTRTWAYGTGDLVYSSPAVADGTLYVGSRDGSVYALDASSGSKLWSFATRGAVTASPAVGHGLVYVGSLRTLYAIAAGTGRLRWSYPVRSDFAPPAIAAGLVYVGGTGGTVYALDADSGKVAWTYRTGGHIESSPAIADGVVYVSAGNGKVYAFDAASGTKRWISDTPGLQYSSPVAVDGTVFVGTFGGIYAFDAATGKKRWTRWVDASVECTPAVAGGMVFTGNRQGDVFALDEDTGHVAWQATAGGQEIFASPAAANGVLYVASKDGTVYAFDAASGTPVWTSGTGGSIVSSPAVVNGMLYVGQYVAVVAYGLP